MAVVLVTGCSSGLGRSVALRLARRGERVYATMRHAERGKELHDEAAAEALDLEVLELDVTSDESVGEAVAQVLERDGTVDVVVNNAGIVHLGSVELLPDALMRDTFETNVFGPLRVLRAVLPTMRAQGSGTVVNVSSCAGRVGGLPIHGSYMASKHALSVLSDSLASTVKPFGIRVVCIEPGFFRTPIFTKSTMPAPSPPRCSTPSITTTGGSTSSSVTTPRPSSPRIGLPPTPSSRRSTPRSSALRPQPRPTPERNRPARRRGSRPLPPNGNAPTPGHGQGADLTRRRPAEPIGPFGHSLPSPSPGR